MVQTSSWLSQLLGHVEMLKNLQNDENVNVIYLDFRKAFHKVDCAIQSSQLDHFNTLMKKLRKSLHFCLDFYKNKHPARWSFILNRAKWQLWDIERVDFLYFYTIRLEKIKRKCLAKNEKYSSSGSSGNVKNFCV